MTDKTLNDGDTDNANTNPDQATVKTYTQQEVDAMMARTKASVTKKVLKPYEGLGDPETLKALATAEEERKQQEAIAKGEFEQALQSQAEKYKTKIQERDEKLRLLSVSQPLTDAAASLRAVNSEQVRNLLQGQVRLNDTGEVEVVDNKGQVRYDDDGHAFTPQALVREFLDSNPHFVQAGPATTDTKSSSGKTKTGEVDVKKFNMRDPDSRAAYKEYRAKRGKA